MMISYADVIAENQKMLISIGTKQEQELWFTNGRIDRETVPEGLYVYDIRHGDDYYICTIEPYVYVNHAGSVIAKRPINLNKHGVYSLYRNPYGWTFL